MSFEPKPSPFGSVTTVRITGGPVGGAAISWPKGLGFHSYLTGFTGHASKPMEHGLWGFDKGFVLRGSSQIPV